MVLYSHGGAGEQAGILKRLWGRHETAQRNARKKKQAMPIFSELHAPNNRAFTNDEQQILNTSTSVIEFPRAFVNGVAFSRKQARRSDNNIVASSWKVGQGNEMKTFYGRITRIFKHEMGGMERMIFAVEWRTRLMDCEKTMLPRVGGIDEAETARCPFVEARAILPHNLIFAPCPAGDHTSCVLECRPTSH
jgi:hypothetical protein